MGENLGFVKDVYAVWELPVAMLLPLAYVPLLPVVRIALTQWRIRGLRCTGACSARPPSG